MTHTSQDKLSRFVGATLAWTTLAMLVGCSGGSAGDRDNRGDFVLDSISTGSGTVYPYRIRAADSFGNPTTTVLNIEDDTILRQNVSGNNGVLPVATFSMPPLLPDGATGSHFLHFRFRHKLDVDSILSDLPANQSNAGLTSALSVIDYDPVGETSQMVRGRGYVGGITYINNGGSLLKVRAFIEDGLRVQLDPDFATAFPSIAAQLDAEFPDFEGAAELISAKSFLFVADVDTANGNVTFPFNFPNNGNLMRIVATAAVRDSEGHALEQEICTATTVGADPNPPQVLGYSTLTNVQIAPGNAQTGIDPTTTVTVRFNKPVQPGEVGSFFDPQNLTPTTGGIVLSVTAAAVTFPVIYHADPLNFGDFCSYTVRPAYNLPGDSAVTVTVQNTTIHSLVGALGGGEGGDKFLSVPGQGIVNAPVAPEVIYVGVGGSDPGISAIDLNGIGQGTGDINSTRFRQALQPNIGVPDVFPALAEGQTNLDAGSAGALTLVRDTNLNTLLLGEPLVGTISDLHIGAPLDLVFNNENVNTNASRANQMNPMLNAQAIGNTITQPPHPNPPRLVYPPPNPARAIFGEEPTINSSTGAPGNILTAGVPGGCRNSPINQLVAGNPFSSTRGEFGLFGTLRMGTFYGPQPAPASPPPPPPFCPFSSRQQIGHFLYALDRDNRQIVIINSNRFTILDTIRLTDPISMAMAPNMTRLAVTNFSSSMVSFIDIDPTSATFNTVVKETRVERGPTGIAWQPDGEDVLVVSSDANFMSIINSQDFSVRRTVSGFLQAPIDVVVTERFQAHGNASGVYYAYILNSNGTVAVYESGPDGVNGIGFNDVIGTIPGISFPRARTMLYDFGAGASNSILVSHVDPSGLGQVSRLRLTSSPGGALPLNPSSGGFILPPTYRQKEWSVVQRFGGLTATTAARDLLSGNSIIDLAQDEMINVGAALGQVVPNVLNNQTPFVHSGKHTVKQIGPAVVLSVTPKLLFIALSDVGKVDVMELSTGRRIATLDVPGVRCVSNYWRQ